MVETIGLKSRKLSISDDDLDKFGLTLTDEIIKTEQQSNFVSKDPKIQLKSWELMIEKLFFQIFSKLNDDDARTLAFMATHSECDP